MTEKAHTKYAWIVLVVLGLLELQFSLSLALLGPAAVDNANVELKGAVAALTIIVMAAVPFRKGERWSWYFLWLLPATALVVVIRNFMLGVRSVVLIDLVGAILYAAVLLVSYRKFFPKT